MSITERYKNNTQLYGYDDETSIFSIPVGGGVAHVDTINLASNGPVLTLPNIFNASYSFYRMTLQFQYNSTAVGAYIDADFLDANSNAIVSTNYDWGVRYLEGAATTTTSRGYAGNLNETNKLVLDEQSRAKSITANHWVIGVLEIRVINPYEQNKRTLAYWEGHKSGGVTGGMLCTMSGGGVLKDKVKCTGMEISIRAPSGTVQFYSALTFATISGFSL